MTHGILLNFEFFLSKEKWKCSYSHDCNSVDRSIVTNFLSFFLENNVLSLWSWDILLVLQICVGELDYSWIVHRHGCKDILLNGHWQHRIAAVINVFPWQMRQIWQWHKWKETTCVYTQNEFIFNYLLNLLFLGHMHRREEILHTLFRKHFSSFSACKWQKLSS